VTESCDIVIAGGGPVGAALALGLRASGLDVVLLEAQPPAAGRDDARSLALSYGSRLILERLGVWQTLIAVTPIQRILVSQQRGFGRVELSATEARMPALGYVTGYDELQRALTAALERSSVRIVAGCRALAVNADANSAVVTTSRGGLQQELAARLMVIADGGANLNLAHIKTRDYQQTALVCNVASERPHRNRAFERFTPGGPVALLPTVQGWSLVWTATPDHAHQLAAVADAEFCACLTSALGAAAAAVFGAFRLLGQRRIFPLVLKYATQPVAPRAVLVGNAAQTLHPVAGQGFNLGLRDAWELARLIMARDTSDPGASALLNAYCAQRHCDRTATILFTDSLIRLFSKDIPLLEPVRSIGLAALGTIPPAKNFLARRMMFGVRG
jgi:2-octaprenyl-6-methoxyphenol hydroxylase